MRTLKFFIGPGSHRFGNCRIIKNLEVGATIRQPKVNQSRRDLQFSLFPSDAANWLHDTKVNDVRSARVIKL